MARVEPTPIPPLATPNPDPNDPGTYGTRGRARWLWETNQFLPGMLRLGNETYQNAGAAADAAALAEAIAHLKGQWSALTGELEPPAIVEHNDKFWILLLELPDVTASEPGVTGDWAIWEEPVAAQIGYDNTVLQLRRNGLPPANLQQVLEALAPRENLLDNVLLGRYQRNAWLTVEPATLAANAWLVDRWRAGATGMTRADGTMAIDRVVRILTGTLRQLVRDPVRVPVGAQVTLGWAGNARGRINGGAWSASPIVWTRSSSDPIEVEFYNDGSGGGASGTLSEPRLYLGGVDHGPSRMLAPSDESLLMRRFYQRVPIQMQTYLPAGSSLRQTLSFHPMVGTPTASVVSTPTNVNVASFGIGSLTAQSFLASMTAAGTGEAHRSAVVALETNLGL